MITLLIIASTTIMFVERPCIKEYPTELLQGCYKWDTDTIEVKKGMDAIFTGFVIKHEFGHKMTRKSFLEGKFKELSLSEEEVADNYAFYLQNPIIVGEKWSKAFKELSTPFDKVK